MKAVEILSKAKELLSIEVEEVKLAQAKLENGTIIEAESIASGQEVFIVTEDEKVALPVGEYQLEDGQMLKVEEEGIIASIGAKEEKPAEEDLSEETETEELAEEKEEMKYATKEELSEVKDMIEEIKAMIKDKEEMSAEEKAEEPVEEPTEEVQQELSAVEKVKHNPESKTKKEMFLYAQKGQGTTLSRVMNKISNN